MIWKKTPPFWKCFFFYYLHHKNQGKRRRFSYHFGIFSYYFNEMRWKMNISRAHNFVKNLIFLKFYWKKISEQIKWYRNQIVIFSISENIPIWYNVVRSFLFGNACFWLSLLAWQILTFKRSANSTGYTPRVQDLLYRLHEDYVQVVLSPFSDLSFLKLKKKWPKYLDRSGCNRF